MRTFHKRNIMIFLISALVSLIGVHFTSCSDVNFSTNTAASDPGNGGLGDGKDGDGDGGGSGDCTDCSEDNIYPVQQDLMVPYVSSKVDVLLMIDNSGSMTAEHKELGARLDGFVKDLKATGIDWQMCYSTTHVDNNPDAGEIIDWVGTGRPVLKPGDGDTESIFRNTMDNIINISDTSGSGNEQGIAASRLAFTDSSNRNCFRKDAALALIILSDEDEASCGARCEFQDASEFTEADEYRRQYRELGPENDPQGLIDLANREFGQKPFTAHSIVIRENDDICQYEQDKQAAAFYGLVYSSLSKKSGGTIGDICAPSYANQLSVIGKRIEESLKAITLKCEPVGDPKITFLSGSSGDYTTRVEGNKVFFEPALTSGDEIRVNYYCQN